MGINFYSAKPLILKKNSNKYLKIILLNLCLPSYIIVCICICITFQKQPKKEKKMFSYISKKKIQNLTYRVLKKRKKCL